MSIKQKLSGRSSGPNLPMNSNTGLQKAEKPTSKPYGTAYKAPTHEKGGASAGGKQAANTRGGVSKGNAAKAKARSIASAAALLRK